MVIHDDNTCQTKHILSLNISYIINSMQQGHSSEANNSSTSYKIPCNFMKPGSSLPCALELKILLLKILNFSQHTSEGHCSLLQLNFTVYTTEICPPSNCPFIFSTHKYTKASYYTLVVFQRK